MIQWSHKIPARDKFSSVLEKWHATMIVLEPFTMTLCIYSQDFLFIPSSQAKGGSLPPKLQGKGMKTIAHPPWILNLKDGVS